MFLKLYVKTPRGEFKLSEMSEAEAEGKGWSFHHCSNNFVIMIKNNEAIAVLKER